MYRCYELPVKPQLADEALRMPIDILLALPDYVVRDEASLIFNLPGAINVLMGGSGWESATEVMLPRIWAEQLSDEQLSQLVQSPVGEKTRPFPTAQIKSLRAKLGLSPFKTMRAKFNFSRYDIVHFTGNIEQNGLDLGERLLPAETLQSRMVNARLLILQNPGGKNDLRPELYAERARRLVEIVTMSGGPPILVVSGRDSASLNRYFFNLYANIVHNQPLAAAAHPGQDDANVWAELFVGEGGDEMLRFDRLFDNLSSRAQTVRQSIEPITERSHKNSLKEMMACLHSEQIKLLEKQMESIDEEFSSDAKRLLSQVKNLNLELLDYNHETGGAMPLAKSSKAIINIEAEAERLRERYPQVMAELNAVLRENALKAPRVLNAAFADPQQQLVLGPRTPLVANREYDFIVDIGPKWNATPTLVKGSSGFPEKALKVDDDGGYLIHVVFISEDLEPTVASNWLWVPQHTGRSFPYDIENKRKAKKDGPIALRLKIPSMEGVDETIKQLRGRLSLYHQNNLIQSALVTAGVVRTPDVVLEVDNVVQVDFVLSGTIQELSRLATRAVKFTEKDAIAEHPIAVNITMNSDGGDGHRVLVRQYDENPSSTNSNSPIGWTPYDPIAAFNALERARDDLKACFYARDGSGKVILDSAKQPVVGLNEDNGKNKTAFRRDLYNLAKLGATLFDKAFGNVRPVGNWKTLAQWTQSLQRTLLTSSIIQVARTAPANYVFPWGLVYQYPLPGPSTRFTFCKVMNEWSDDGKRTAPLATSCPFKDENWHVENIICPYGFWGLNHIIEQPLSALRRLDDGTYTLGETPDKIGFGSSLDLSMGVTHDLAQADLKAHIGRLGQIQKMRIHPPDPADDMDKVRAMLKSTSLVYFLCHGEYDAVEQEPYLGIGLRDNNPLHRIYPKTLHGWARTNDFNAWHDLHPLVFINGCHTANLKPGEVLNFVTAFNFAGASGVIGTEVAVILPLAAEISESLFRKIASDVPVGQAMREVRWELANKGNLLGLAYTLYCLANLRFTGN
jgi:hypothetical protein